MRIPREEINDKDIASIAIDCADVVEKQVELSDEEFEKVTEAIKLALSKVLNYEE